MKIRGIMSVLLVAIAGKLGALSAPGIAMAETQGQGTRPMTTDFDHERLRTHVTGVGPWVVYQDPSVVGATFEYPQNWVVGSEIGREQPYRQVIILGPRNPENTWSTGLTIRQYPTKAAGGLYPSLQALIEARRKQYGSNASFQRIEEGARPLGDLQTWQSVFTYVVPLPPHSVQAKPTAIQTRLVLFAAGDALYEVSYTADASQYPTYQDVFDHLLQTLKLITP